MPTFKNMLEESNYHGFVTMVNDFDEVLSGFEELRRNYRNLGRYAKNNQREHAVAARARYVDYLEWARQNNIDLNLQPDKAPGSHYTSFGAQFINLDVRIKDLEEFWGEH